MRKKSIFTSLFILCSACFYLSYSANATTISIADPDTRGVVTVTIEANFDNAQGGKIESTVGGMYVSKGFSNVASAIVTRSFDTTLIRPGESSVISAKATSYATNTFATDTKTIVPHNDVSVNIDPVEYRGIKQMNAVCRFPSSLSSYGKVRVVISAQDYMRQFLFPQIKLSSTIETEQTVSFDFRSVPFYDGPNTVDIYSQIYSSVGESWVKTTTITLNNRPDVEIRSGGEVQGSVVLSGTYTFPTTDFGSGIIRLECGETSVEKAVLLSADEETSGTISCTVDTTTIPDGNYAVVMKGWFVYGSSKNDPHFNVDTKVITVKNTIDSDKTKEVPLDKRTNVGDPIDVATGKVTSSSIDMRIPATGLDLVWSRLYNNRMELSTDTFIGHKWRTMYSHSVEEKADGTIIEIDADGVYTYYRKMSDGTYTPSAGKTTVLTKQADGFHITYPHGLEYTFTDEGKLESIIDRTGSSIMVTYDGNGVPARIEHSSGKTLTCVSDGTHITSVTDLAGNTVTYQYDAAGHLSSVTDATGSTEYYSYDSNHNMVSKINKNGTPLYWSYDTEDRSVSSWQNNNTNVVHLNFTEPGKTIVTDSLGNQTTYEYNDYGLVHTVTDAVGNKEYTGWDDDLNKTYVTDKNGNTTNFAYDDQGNLIQVTDPSAAITTFEYEPLFNQVTRSIDALGNQTLYTYDTKGNITSVTDALGNSTQYTYDTRGNVITTTDARGNSTQFAYDTADNLITVTDALGNQTQFIYDAVGNVLSTIDARGNTTQFEYDALNRVTQVTYADNTTVAYRYDAEGNRIGITDAKGNETQFEYDPFQRLTKVIDALNAVTEYAYDTEGNQLSIKDANQHQTSYTYDNLQRLIKEVSALAKEKSYTYDAVGNVSQKTDGRGQMIDYTYDYANRLASVNYPLTSVLYEYDQLGRRTSITDTHGTTTYTYDALSRLTRVDGPESNDTIQYEYDAVGNRTKMIDQNADVTTYEYDVLNRLISVCRGGSQCPPVAMYTYDAVSNVTRVDYANGTYAVYTYDNRNRVTSLTNTKPDGTVLSSFTYHYDANGMRTKTTLKNEAYIEYEYDAVNRLVKETKERINLKNNEVTRYLYEYTYDALGNRTNMERMYNKNLFWDYYGSEISDEVMNFLELYKFGPQDSDYTGPFEKKSKLYPKWPILNTAYQYDADNELLKLSEDLTYQGSVFDIKSEDFVYDENGNLREKTDDRNQKTEYGYDEENRLTSVICPLTSVFYVYDATGKRIQSNDNGVITNYYYDGMSPIVERDANGNLIASYTRGVGYGGGIGSIVSKNTPKFNKKGVLAKYTSQYYHYDAIGNVVNLSGPGGNATATYVYDAFGNELRARGKKADDNPYHFSTKEIDSTSLVYFGARYYNPEIGRWITQDPMGMIDGPNMYAYVGNNPVNFVDAWGLCKEDAVSVYAQFGHFGIRIGGVWYDFIPLDNRISGPGAVSETDEKPYGAIDILTVPNSEAYSQDVKDAIDKSSQERPDFNVFTRNCLGWVIQMIAEGYMRNQEN